MSDNKEVSCTPAQQEQPQQDNKAASLASSTATATAATAPAAPVAAATTAAPPALQDFPVTVTVIPEYASIPKSQFQFNPINALVVVQSGSSTEPRVPIELVLLCDNSGSMAGTRIRECRAAAHAVVNHLQGDDIVHVICYNSSATLLASGGPSTANILHDQIDNLAATGCTNIEAALNLAYSMLHNSKNRTHTKRCFLFSDGQPTTGMMSAAALGDLAAPFGERDWGVSTFGIGEGISPEILMKIADSGNGKYDFVSERRIQELTNKAFSGLSRLMGCRASLTLAPLSGSKFATTSNTEIGEYTQIGDFKFDATTRFITRLSFQNVNTETLPEGILNAVPILKVEFVFQDPNAPLRAPIVVSGMGSVALLDDGNNNGDGTSPQQRSVRDPTVAVLLALRDCGVMFERIDGFLEKGATADAIELLREVVSELERHLDNDLDGMVHVQLRRSKRTLERLEVDGDRAARRAQLEIGHQREAVRDRLSVCDFASSDSSNRSGNFEMRRGGGGGSPGSPARLPARRLRRLSVGSGGSTSPDDDTDDTDDDDDTDFGTDDTDSMRRQLS